MMHGPKYYYLCLILINHNFFFQIFKSTIMDEFHYIALCNESLEGNINLKSNISIPIDSCNSYVNHTELYIERE